MKKPVSFLKCGVRFPTTDGCTCAGVGSMCDSHNSVNPVTLLGGGIDRREPADVKVVRTTTPGAPGMSFLFDVETTGLFSKGGGGDPPRLVSVAWIVLRTNHRLAEQAYFVVRPDGFEIPAESSAVHGIRQDHAIAEGKPVREVLDKITAVLAQCHTVVAHNLEFDAAVMRSEFARVGAGDPFAGKTTVCTMKIGAATLFGGAYPKLTDLYAALHPGSAEDVVEIARRGNAHDARYDAWYLSKVYTKLCPADPEPSHRFHGDVKVDLTPEQSAAIYADPDIDVLVLASAGSGKSFTTVCRIQYLLDDVKVDPRGLVITTFSKAAATDLSKKLFRAMGRVPPEASIGTIDAIAHRDGDGDASFLQVGEYAYRLLDAIQKTPERFRHITHVFVDEFQDVNDVQFEILAALHDRVGARLFVVGDPAQNVYAFRGASVKHILGFEERFSARVFRLTANFRSVPGVVRFANASLACQRIPSSRPMTSASGIEDASQVRPVVRRCAGIADQTRYVVSTIRDLVRRGTVPGPGRIAVLCFTNRPLTDLADCLNASGVFSRVLENSEVRNEVAPGAVEAGDAVCLSTVHKAKGLEWDVVFLVSASDRRGLDDDPGSVDETRRLFYVAVTRARKQLWITYASERVTRFVRELPDDVYDHDGRRSADDVPGPAPAPAPAPSPRQLRATTVTAFVKSLDGADWKALRESGVVPATRPDQTKLYESFQHPPESFVAKGSLFAEFGTFVDAYVVREITRLTRSAVIGNPNEHAVRAISRVLLDDDAFRAYTDSCGPAVSIALRDRSAVPTDPVAARIVSEIRASAALHGIDPRNVPVSPRWANRDAETVESVSDSLSRVLNASVPSAELVDDLWVVSGCRNRAQRAFRAIPGQLASVYGALMANVSERFCAGVAAAGDTIRCHGDVATPDGSLQGNFDLLVGKTLYEIKASRAELELDWVLQALCYVAMLPAGSVDTVVVFNALQGTTHAMDVSGWLGAGTLMDFVVASCRRKTSTPVMVV